MDSSTVLPTRAAPLRRAVSIGMFVVLHLAAFSVLLVHFSWALVALAVGSYLFRMWAVTTGYHRYFAHRSFKTSRAFQFVLAWLGASAVQNGPLWWASWHRVHHRWSDAPNDAHSPVQRGFWHAQAGWYWDGSHIDTNLSNVKDLARFPELRFIEKHAWLPPLTYAIACFAIAGVPGIAWGFFLPTIVLLHVVGLVNSLAHVWGSRRFATSDQSRNNALIAVLTLGEGWHNNHHHYAPSARQGFYWWEIDVSFYVLKVLSWLGIVWGIKSPTRAVLARNRIRRPRVDAVKTELQPVP